MFSVRLCDPFPALLHIKASFQEFHEEKKIDFQYFREEKLIDYATFHEEKKDQNVHIFHTKNDQTDILNGQILLICLTHTRSSRKRGPPLQTLFAQFCSAPGRNTVGPESQRQPSPRTERRSVQLGVI